MLRELQCNAILAADPAMSLEFAPQERTDAVLVFLRHPNAMHTRQAELLAEALRLHPDAKLCACDASDAEYVRSLGHVPVTFASPQECLSAVSGAQSVLSLGRYHPAVFARMAGTPCCVTGKAEPLADELGVAVDLCTPPPPPPSPMALRDRLAQGYRSLLDSIETGHFARSAIDPG
jgi:hypothetical protein